MLYRLRLLMRLLMVALEKMTSPGEIYIRQTPQSQHQLQYRLLFSSNITSTPPQVSARTSIVSSPRVIGQRLILLVFDDCPLKLQLNSAIRLEGKQKSDADDSLGKSVDCSSKSFTIMTLSSINCQ
ncbi:hypothetical protein RRG08_062062 [Elysia crispata]|uniref:Uncharacterized protein n=1 Tax=Elysia crispata TaxID=231223 RepID=A0AAE1DBQ6_9GAST|nr:hypothetical protein RRG08_062062 [Elysia crispata]